MRLLTHVYGIATYSHAYTLCCIMIVYPRLDVRGDTSLLVSLTCCWIVLLTRYNRRWKESEDQPQKYGHNEKQVHICVQATGEGSGG